MGKRLPGVSSRRSSRGALGTDSGAGAATSERRGGWGARSSPRARPVLQGALVLGWPTGGPCGQVTGPQEEVGVQVGGSSLRTVLTCKMAPSVPLAGSLYRC